MCVLYKVQSTYFYDFLEQLDEEPIPVYLNATDYGAVTRRDLVQNGIFPALYRPASWPRLAEALTDLLQGNSTTAYKAYSNSWIAGVLTDDSNTMVIYAHAELEAYQW